MAIAMTGRTGSGVGIATLYVTSTKMLREDRTNLLNWGLFLIRRLTSMATPSLTVKELLVQLRPFVRLLVGPGQALGISRPKSQEAVLCAEALII